MARFEEGDLNINRTACDWCRRMLSESQLAPLTGAQDLCSECAEHFDGDPFEPKPWQTLYDSIVNP